jgi:hypothetical protein
MEEAMPSGLAQAGGVERLQDRPHCSGREKRKETAIETVLRCEIGLGINPGRNQIKPENKVLFDQLRHPHLKRA